MKYFTIAELTRSATAAARGIDNTPDAAVISRLTALVDNVLDPLRQMWGAPLYVNSGYRCDALNRAVGGVPSSQHRLGSAADITTGTRAGNRRLAAMLLASDLPYDQLIDECDASWLHVSHAPHPRRQYLRRSRGNVATQRDKSRCPGQKQ